jgi:hypothetical protein
MVGHHLSVGLGDGLRQLDRRVPPARWTGTLILKLWPFYLLWTLAVAGAAIANAVIGRYGVAAGLAGFTAVGSFMTWLGLSVFLHRRRAK